MAELPRIERNEAGSPVFFHLCTIGQRQTVLRMGPDGWQWGADGSLMPSVHCLECGTHGFWTTEGWRAC